MRTINEDIFTDKLKGSSELYEKLDKYPQTLRKNEIFAAKHRHKRHKACIHER